MRIFLPILLTLAIGLTLTSCKSRRSGKNGPNAGFERVETAQEFLQALRPGARILLATGDYNLTEMAGMTTSYLSWDDPYDGEEVHLANLSNVIIRGEDGARLLAVPRYAWVLRFDQCNNLKFENVTFGHTEEGYCLGGVLAFEGCTGISISECNLYGSGTEGLLLNGVVDFKMEDSRIYECTYDLMTVNGSRNLLFENCSFTETGQFNLINLSASEDVLFDECTFSENYNENFMPYFFYLEGNRGGIAVRNCTFTENRVQKFVNRPSELELDDNDFEGNDFD